MPYEIINPAKAGALYPPETLLESTVVDEIPPAGKTIYDYRGFAPDRWIVTQSVNTARNDKVSIRLYVDGEALSELNCGARKSIDEVDDTYKVVATESLQLVATATASVTNFPIRLKLTVDYPTIAKKLAYGIDLTGEEMALMAKYQTSAKELTTIYKELEGVRREISYKEESQIFTLSAGEKEVDAGNIPVPNGYVARLREIRVDRPTYTDIYLSIRRDAQDEYMKLNTYAMPLGATEKVNVPAVDEISFMIVTTAEKTEDVNIPLTYKWSMHKISVLEKLRWGLELDGNEIAAKEDIEKKYNVSLDELVKVGIL